MHYHDIQIVLQEVPGEVSICFTITGCQKHCTGCHSPYLWKKESGQALTPELFTHTLEKYDGLASCILFMGGEWHEETLIQYLQHAKSKGYNTCLYTGDDQIDENIMKELTYLKTGQWKQELGGLDKNGTNQQFIQVNTNKNLNYLFLKSHS